MQATLFALHVFVHLPPSFARSVAFWLDERGILLEDRLFEDLKEMQDYCKRKRQ